jgi:hypothetical protein
MGVVAFNRTLEQELLALARGASLECLICGEFVLRQGDALTCLECGCKIAPEADSASSQLHLDLQAG